MTKQEAADELQKILDAWKAHKSCSVNPEALEIAVKALRKGVDKK